jgi:hypothetical protein
MIQQQGMKVFKNLFTLDTIKHMVSSIGESVTDVLIGDAYMKGKSIVAAILSVMGATAFLNFVTRGALKAGIASLESGMKRKIADAYTLNTPKINAFDLTSGRSFSKPKVSVAHSE